MSCSQCSAVADVIRSQTEKLKDVWRFREIIRNQGCKTCQIVVEAFTVFNNTSPNDDSVGWIHNSQSEYGWRLDIRKSEDIHNYTPAGLWLIRTQGEDGPQTPVGSPVADQHINLTTIKDWIHNCNQNHKACNLTSDPWSMIRRGTGLYFIDVERLCIIEQPQHGHDQYTALSYVWGATSEPPLQTVISNLEALSQEFAFDRPTTRARLPKTIQHAMFLTRALGLKYLWVDRFCIVQDDLVTKPSQLAMMAAVYANAYVTIVASEGDDGDFGLPGISPDCPRQQPFRTFEFEDTCRMLEHDPRSALLDKQMQYHTRGWWVTN